MHFHKFLQYFFKIIDFGELNFLIQWVCSKSYTIMSLFYFRTASLAISLMLFLIKLISLVSEDTSTSSLCKLQSSIRQLTLATMINKLTFAQCCCKCAIRLSSKTWAFSTFYKSGRRKESRFMSDYFTVSLFNKNSLKLKRKKRA